MEVRVDTEGSFKTLEKLITDVVSEGCEGIMVFHAEGGIDRTSQYKKHCDKLLERFYHYNVGVFGGIFPGIFDNSKLMPTGTIVAGIKSKVHLITLENLDKEVLKKDLEFALQAIKHELEEKEYKTIFVFGDGYGEKNLNLINALNLLVKQYPLNVIGGLSGRSKIRASNYTIFTPKKIIQNGAVLAFTKLESGIGARHGWKPLIESTLEVTRINGCFIEEINGIPALDFYMSMITALDTEIYKRKDELLGNADLFFDHIAIKYPLGIIHNENGVERIIDRTAISVGGDKSLQFSAEIPVGTKICILNLEGKTLKEQCVNLKNAAKEAYDDSEKNFPENIKEKRIIIMDCFGRKRIIENLGENFEMIELEEIASNQKEKEHSPIGPLTFGEISSLDGNYVELHNKTAVVGTIEDN